MLLKLKDSLAPIALGFALVANVSFADSFSITEPDYKWPKRDLKICFEIAPGTEHPDLSLLEEVVTQEYAADRTGIYFTGWTECSSESDLKSIDVKIKAFRSPRYVGFTVPLGYDGFEDARTQVFHRRKKTGPSVVQIDFNHFAENPSKGDDPLAGLKMTLLHELGHVAGLRDEHAYPGGAAKKDPSCWHAPRDETFGSAVAYGAYDPHSVMSYCLSSIVGQFGTRVYFDATAKRGTVPNYIFGKYRTIPWLPEITDPTMAQVSWDDAAKLERIDLKVGLSEGDRFALRSLYPLKEVK